MSKSVKNCHMQHDLSDSYPRASCLAQDAWAVHEVGLVTGADPKAYIALVNGLSLTTSPGNKAVDVRRSRS